MTRVPGPWIINQDGVHFRLEAELDDPTHKEFIEVQEWLALVSETLKQNWDIAIKDG